MWFILKIKIIQATHLLTILLNLDLGLNVQLYFPMNTLFLRNYCSTRTVPGAALPATKKSLPVDIWKNFEKSVTTFQGGQKSNHTTN